MLHLGKEGLGGATCLFLAAELGREDVNSSNLPSSSGFFRLAGKVEKELSKVFLVGRGQEFFKIPIFKQQAGGELSWSVRCERGQVNSTAEERCGGASH